MSLRPDPLDGFRWRCDEAGQSELDDELEELLDEPLSLLGLDSFFEPESEDEPESEEDDDPDEVEELFFLPWSFL